MVASVFGYIGSIDPSGVSRISMAVSSALTQGVDEITIAISSPGGDFASGMYLYSLIRGSPVPIVMHNLGTVASVATTVFSGAQRRISCPHGSFMLHPVAPSQGGLFPASKLARILAAAQGDEDRTEAILRAHTRLTDERLAARRIDEVYLSANEALHEGLIDDIRDFKAPAAGIIQI